MGLFRSSKFYIKKTDIKVKPTGFEYQFLPA